MPNAITVLWRTCVKFTKLQNLIFFKLLPLHALCGAFSSYPVVNPSSQIRSAVWVTHSPIFCSVFLFLQLLSSNRSNDDRLQWKQRFDSLSRGVQCSHHGRRAGLTH